MGTRVAIVGLLFQSYKVADKAVVRNTYSYGCLCCLGSSYKIVIAVIGTCLNKQDLDTFESAIDNQAE